MTEYEPTEQTISRVRFDALINLVALTQRMLDDFVMRHPIPLGNLTDQEQQDITDRMIRRLEFELSQEEIESDIPIAVSGDGVLIATDESGEIAGSERLDETDIFIGTVSEIGVSIVPALSSKDLNDAGKLDGDTVAVILSTTLIVKDGYLYTGVRDDGKYNNEHDLSEHTSVIAFAYPWKIRSPLAYAGDIVSVTM